MNYLYAGPHWQIVDTDRPFPNPVPVPNPLPEGTKGYVLAGEWKRVEVPGQPIPFAVGQVLKGSDDHDYRIICTDRSWANGFGIVALRRAQNGNEYVHYFSVRGLSTSNSTRLLPLIGPAKTELRWVPNPEFAKLVDDLNVASIGR